jgi:DNA-binding LacI/PurR family transcriptional regulator
VLLVAARIINLSGSSSAVERQAPNFFQGKSGDFTAVLAFNDGSAIGAIRAIQDAGLTVPHDVSVVRVDDIETVGFTSPRLTTVWQPLRTMGEMAASTLLQRIDGGEVAEETFVRP